MEREKLERIYKRSESNDTLTFMKKYENCELKTVNDLDQKIQQLLKDTSHEIIDQEELLAVSEISVKEKIDLFESIARGLNKKKAVIEITEKLVEKRRLRKIKFEKRRLSYEKKIIELKYFDLYVTDKEQVTDKEFDIKKNIERKIKIKTSDEGNENENEKEYERINECINLLKNLRVEYGKCKDLLDKLYEMAKEILKEDKDRALKRLSRRELKDRKNFDKTFSNLSKLFDKYNKLNGDIIFDIKNPIQTENLLDILKSLREQKEVIIKLENLEEKKLILQQQLQKFRKEGIDLEKIIKLQMKKKDDLINVKKDLQSKLDQKKEEEDEIDEDEKMDIQLISDQLVKIDQIMKCSKDFDENVKLFSNDVTHFINEKDLKEMNEIENQVEKRKKILNEILKDFNSKRIEFDEIGKLRDGKKMMEIRKKKNQEIKKKELEKSLLAFEDYDKFSEEIKKFLEGNKEKIIKVNVELSKKIEISKVEQKSKEFIKLLESNLELSKTQLKRLNELDTITDGYVEKVNKLRILSQDVYNESNEDKENSLRKEKDVLTGELDVQKGEIENRRKSFEELETQIEDLRVKNEKKAVLLENEIFEKDVTNQINSLMEHEAFLKESLSFSESSKKKMGQMEENFLSKKDLEEDDEEFKGLVESGVAKSSVGLCILNEIFDISNEYQSEIDEQKGLIDNVKNENEDAYMRRNVLETFKVRLLELNDYQSNLKLNISKYKECEKQLQIQETELVELTEIISKAVKEKEFVQKEKEFYKQQSFIQELFNTINVEKKRLDDKKKGLLSFLESEKVKGNVELKKAVESHVDIVGKELTQLELIEPLLKEFESVIEEKKELMNKIRFEENKEILNKLKEGEMLKDKKKDKIVLEIENLHKGFENLENLRKSLENKQLDVEKSLEFLRVEKTFGVKSKKLTNYQKHIEWLMIVLNERHLQSTSDMTAYNNLLEKEEDNEMKDLIQSNVEIVESEVQKCSELKLLLNKYQASVFEARKITMTIISSAKRKENVSEGELKIREDIILNEIEQIKSCITVKQLYLDVIFRRRSRRKMIQKFFLDEIIQNQKVLSSHMTYLDNSIKLIRGKCDKKEKMIKNSCDNLEKNVLMKELDLFTQIRDVTFHALQKILTYKKRCFAIFHENEQEQEEMEIKLDEIRSEKSKKIDILREVKNVIAKGDSSPESEKRVEELESEIKDLSNKIEDEELLYNEISEKLFPIFKDLLSKCEKHVRMMGKEYKLSVKSYHIKVKKLVNLVDITSEDRMVRKNVLKNLFSTFFIVSKFLLSVKVNLKLEMLLKNSIDERINRMIDRESIDDNFKLNCQAESEKVKNELSNLGFLLNKAKSLIKGFPDLRRIFTVSVLCKNRKEYLQISEEKVKMMEKFNLKLDQLFILLIKHDSLSKINKEKIKELEVPISKIEEFSKKYFEKMNEIKRYTDENEFLMQLYEERIYSDYYSEKEKEDYQKGIEEFEDWIEDFSVKLNNLSGKMNLYLHYSIMIRIIQDEDILKEINLGDFDKFKSEYEKFYEEFKSKKVQSDKNEFDLNGNKVLELEKNILSKENFQKKTLLIGDLSKKTNKCGNRFGVNYLQRRLFNVVEDVTSLDDDDDDDEFLQYKDLNLDVKYEMEEKYNKVKIDFESFMSIMGDIFKEETNPFLESVEVFKDEVQSTKIEIRNMIIEKQNEMKDLEQRESSIDSEKEKALIKFKKAAIKKEIKARNNLIAAVDDLDSGIVEVKFSKSKKKRRVFFSELKRNYLLFNTNMKDSIALAYSRYEQKLLEYEWKKEEEFEDTERHRVDIKDFETTGFLNMQFPIAKYYPKKKIKIKKSGLFEIEYLGKRIKLLKKNGGINRVMKPDDLLTVERYYNDIRKLRLLFYEENKSFDICCVNNTEREWLYSLLCGIRPVSFSWCPNLVRKGTKRCKTTFHGSYDKPKDYIGKSGTFDGNFTMKVTTNPYEEVFIWCCTWNWGGEKPSARDIKNIIPLDKKFDLYVLCIQESPFKKGFDCKEFFMNKVFDSEKIKHKEFITLNVEQVGKTVLIVVSNVLQTSRISNVKATAVELHKGMSSIGISISFNEFSLLFIGSHFPNVGEFEKREECFEKTVLELKNGRYESFDFYAQFHYIFWMGDLGFKIENIDSYEELKKKRGFSVKTLLDHEVLKQEMMNGSIFYGFKEPKINFKPTYPYGKRVKSLIKVKDTNPCYPDRILYKHFKGLSLTEMEYSTTDSCIAANHLPVRGLFKIHTLLPYNIVAENPENRILIEFLKIKYESIESLRTNYKVKICFYSHFVDEWVESKVVYYQPERSSASWSRKSLPILKTNNKKMVLEKQYVFIVIKKDVTKGGGSDIIMSCNFPLKEALVGSMETTNGGEYNFSDVDCYFNGKLNGYLSGSISMRYEDEE